MCSELLASFAATILSLLASALPKRAHTTHEGQNIMGIQRAAHGAETSEICSTAIGIELLYTPAESLFAAAAPDMVANGWSVFPQEVDRMPGRVYGAPIKWSEEHDLKSRLPTPEALELWRHHCATLNVACVFGSGSGYAFAIDIDVMDPAASTEIQAEADRNPGLLPTSAGGHVSKNRSHIQACPVRRRGSQEREDPARAADARSVIRGKRGTA